MQELMTNHPAWKLQEKIRPVLRNYKTEVKIAAIKATWSLSTGQSHSRQRRIAAKFGIREINRMLLSSSRNTKDDGETNENIQILQMLGLTILRSYCYKWPSGQIICSAQETLINLRQLLIIFLIPGKSSTKFQILLLKTIRDLLSIDGCYLVNSKVKEEVINIGIPTYLIAIYENYNSEFQRIEPKISLLMIQILNFINQALPLTEHFSPEQLKTEFILNESLPLCLDMKEFRNVISLAHFSVARTNMIQLNWFLDVKPAIDLYLETESFKKLSELCAFVIFCSPKIEDIEPTNSVAYVCQKLFEMLVNSNLDTAPKSIKYSCKVIATLPVIGVNYLNALAKNDFIGILLENLETLECKFAANNLTKQEFSTLEQLLVSAITTFTVDACGRRLVLAALRKKPQLIDIILRIVTPDYLLA